MRKGPKKGTIWIDKQDIVGQYLGKYKVVSYSGMYYDNTKGGLRLRHWYNCARDNGIVKFVQRGQLLSKRGGTTNGN